MRLSDQTIAICECTHLRSRNGRCDETKRARHEQRLYFANSEETGHLGRQPSDLFTDKYSQGEVRLASAGSLTRCILLAISGRAQPVSRARLSTSRARRIISRF
jgi:hypothetical protein